jgi:hypothetical protein
LYVVIGCYHSVSGCNLEGRVWWYSSLPGVGKPLMVVVTVQGANPTLTYTVMNGRPSVNTNQPAHLHTLSISQKRVEKKKKS